ncbi:S8 family serine peptidase [Cohnella lubricantis]|uniref:S8 family serine peptidase n=1 Tax=Cohnella lubricantis TaxID=2163172 RepID=A0A841T9B2_9BACL|nr:S8 family serine peptidase [Cohnella lubricantis]MBB6677532.1 S8 family serine peptidase [Cohnella lubricantis]MBP2116582.1 major intracellular serine protease [Cohnella lubricantis]
MTNRVADELGVKEFWEHGLDGSSVVVAVIDSGFALEHPELSGRVIGTFRATFTGDPDDMSDVTGHGTAVASIIAGATVGIAPSVKLLLIKVAGDDGSQGAGSIANGIKYAVGWRGPNGERVSAINMSLGGPASWVDMHDQIKRAVAANILVVCSGGNSGDGNATTDEWDYPAGFAEVVSVGAYDTSFKVAHFSNSNAEIDLIGPGAMVDAACHTGGLRTFSGTSSAAPCVSAASALLIQQFRRDMGRDPTEPELYALLVKHTTTQGIVGSTDRRLIGNGRLRLTYADAPPKPYTVDDISFEDALRGFMATPIDGRTGGAPTIDSPDLWLKLSAKQQRGEAITPQEFRFFELLVRKTFTALKNSRA